MPACGERSRPVGRQPRRAVQSHRGQRRQSQACGSTANGLVAGVLVPLVMHSTVLLALSSLLMMCVGLFAWIYLRHRWPEVGRHSTTAV